MIISAEFVTSLIERAKIAEKCLSLVFLSVSFSVKTKILESGSAPFPNDGFVGLENYCQKGLIRLILAVFCSSNDSRKFENLASKKIFQILNDS